MILLKFTLITALAMAAYGCKSSHGYRLLQKIEDEKTCRDYGFKPGSSNFTACLGVLRDARLSHGNRSVEPAHSELS